MTTPPSPAPGVSRLHGLWLVVFGWEALDGGRGLSHQLGGAALLLLFGALVVTEIRSHREQHRRELLMPTYEPIRGLLPVREQEHPRVTV